MSARLITIDGTTKPLKEWLLHYGMHKKMFWYGTSVLGLSATAALQRKIRRQTGLFKKYRAEYQIWKAMKLRCRYPGAIGWKRYGGRGIKVHPRWLDFAAFLEDVGPRPQTNGQRWLLDRTNNDGDYEPGNVRWVLELESIRNRRNTKYVTWKGRRVALLDLTRAESTLPHHIVAGRIKNGWGVGRALSVPLHASRVVNTVKFRGRSVSIAALAKQYRINRRTLQNRIGLLGWSIVQALARPINTAHRRKGSR